MKPNLFGIATKELSQDAFITWLLQYADNACEKEDPKLNQCGKEFIKALIQAQLPSFDEDIVCVKAGRQWENIDIWAEVNKKYFIIIEDKTHTRQHSNQLNRYRETAQEYCNEYKFEHLICIYIKTGNESQSSLKKVKSKGYTVFDRVKLISILEKYTEIKNAIFVDFLERLIRLEQENQQFSEKEISQWKSKDWQGFYQFIEKQNIFSDLNWGYAANPNGGLMYCCFSFLEWKHNTGIYMQLESDKARLCFKVETEDYSSSNERTKVRNELYRLFFSYAKEQGFAQIKKPERFGNGTYMTFAVVDVKDWLGNGMLDQDRVLNTLIKYQNLFQNFINKYV